MADELNDLIRRNHAWSERVRAEDGAATAAAAIEKMGPGVISSNNDARPHYSSWSATSGSTFIARRAGT